MKFGIAMAAVAAFALMPFAANAQETPAATAVSAAGPLAFQLNKAETREGSCQLTFVVQNDTGTVIEKSIYNIAIVDTDGAVSQLVNIEFRPLPVGRPKVQGFGIAGVPCENISAISINEFNECTTGRRHAPRRSARTRSPSRRACPISSSPGRSDPALAAPEARGDPRCSTSSSPSSAPSAARC